MPDGAESKQITTRSDVLLELREIEHHFALIRAALGGKLACGSGPDAARNRAAVDKLNEACELAVGPAWRDRYR